MIKQAKLAIQAKLTNSVFPPLNKLSFTWVCTYTVGDAILTKEVPLFWEWREKQPCFARMTTGVPWQTKATNLLSSIMVVAKYFHSVVHKFSLPAYVLSDASPLGYLNAVR